MRHRQPAFFTTLLCLVLGTGLPACDRARPLNADRIFHDATILTLAAGQAENGKSPTALAVRDGRIVAVSNLASGGYPAHWAGAETEITDLDGKVLMPGFVQSHAHFNLIALKRMTVDLAPPPDGKIGSFADLKTALAAAAENIPPGHPIMGIGYDDTLILEKRHPTRAELDGISTQHPIILLHISFHLAVLNSKALEMAGVDAQTPDPEGGLIRREAGGTRPNGVLEETAMNVIGKILPQPAPRQVFSTYDAVIQDLLAKGYTTIVEHASDEAMEKGFAAYFASRPVPVDIIAYRRVVPGSDMPENITRADVKGFKLGGIKLFLDGSIQGHTGHLSSPYHVQPAGKADDYRGYPHLPTESFRELVNRAYRADLPIMVHANGDAAIDTLLDALDAAEAAHPGNTIRPVGIHAQTMRRDQLDRARNLGLIPSFFVDHVYFWGDRHRDVFLGPERAARISPAGSAEKRNMIYTLHDDAPVVPADPFRSMWVAVTRRTSSGRKLGADEAITREAALRALTLNSAHMHYIEDEKGSLEIGKKADMIVLDANPLTVPETQLREIRVLETVKDGMSVHTSGG